MADITQEQLRQALMPKAPGAQWMGFRQQKKRPPGRFDFDLSYTLGKQTDRDEVEATWERDLLANHRLKDVHQMGKRDMFWATVGLVTDGGLTVSLERLIKSDRRHVQWHGWQVVLKQNEFIGEQIQICQIHITTGRRGEWEFVGAPQKLTVKHNGPWTVELDRPVAEAHNLILAYKDAKFGKK